MENARAKCSLHNNGFFWYLFFPKEKYFDYHLCSAGCVIFELVITPKNIFLLQTGLNINCLIKGFIKGI